MLGVVTHGACCAHAVAEPTDRYSSKSAAKSYLTECASPKHRTLIIGATCPLQSMLFLCTEVQLLSFVCSTGGKGDQPRLWNIQRLGAVPSYGTFVAYTPQVSPTLLEYYSQPPTCCAKGSPCTQGRLKSMNTGGVIGSNLDNQIFDLSQLSLRKIKIHRFLSLTRLRSFFPFNIS